MYLKLEMVIKRWIYIQIWIFKTFLAPGSILYKSSKKNVKLTYKIKKLEILSGRGKLSRIRVRYGSEPVGVVTALQNKKFQKMGKYTPYSPFIWQFHSDALLWKLYEHTHKGADRTFYNSFLLLEQLSITASNCHKTGKYRPWWPVSKQCLFVN